MRIYEVSQLLVAHLILPLRIDRVDRDSSLDEVVRLDCIRIHIEQDSLVLQERQPHVLLHVLNSATPTDISTTDSARAQTQAASTHLCRTMTDDSTCVSICRTPGHGPSDSNIGSVTSVPNAFPSLANGIIIRKSANIVPSLRKSSRSLRCHRRWRTLLELSTSSSSSSGYCRSLPNPKFKPSRFAIWTTSATG